MSSFNQQQLEYFNNFEFMRDWLAMTDIAKSQPSYHSPQEQRLWQWIETYPGFAFVPHPRKAWTIAMQIVYRGDISRVRRLFEQIRRPAALVHNVWFFKSKDGKTLFDAASGENHQEIFPQVFQYVRDAQNNAQTMLTLSSQELSQWNRFVEFAKQGINRNRVLEYLRGHNQWCYLLPVNNEYRKWTIAMQMVYQGNPQALQELFTACPMPDSSLWFACGNDGKSMVDVALEGHARAPQMWQFAHRAFVAPIAGPEPQPVFDPTPTLTPVPDPTPAPIPAPLVSSSGTASLTLEAVQVLWGGVSTVNLRRGRGECPILGDTCDLVSCSLDCGHKAGKAALWSYIQSKLTSGPFPVRCPMCAAAGPSQAERGFFTRSLIKSFVAAQVLPDTPTGQRLLLQQLRNLPNEDTLDLLYRSSKPCPGCHTPITKYKGHGCHHIKPGQGCPGCHNHFCYVCLGGLSPVWQGCGNNCPGFCNDTCDCPICPDCRPGQSCDLCSGNCPACR